MPGTNGSVRIISGATVGYFSPSFGGNDLGAATLELVAFLHNDSPALQQTSTSPRDVRLNGAAGLLTTLVNRSPQSGAEADVLFTMLRPQGVFYVLCLAPQPDFPRFQQVFQQLLSSIRFNE
jgi:hypothetical protein